MGVKTSGNAGETVQAAALSLRSIIGVRADEIEQARRIPADLSRKFAEAGFYRMYAPEFCGGLELAPNQAMRVVETLATADGSSAWVVFIGATSGSVLAYIPREEALNVFADTDNMIAGVFAPRGKALAESGGFRVNGRWQWGSGTQNAQWILGGCVVTRDGKVERMSNGTPLSRMMLVPASDVELLDTWNVSGLCGTGSTDFAMTDLFVPETRAVGLAADEALDRPLYKFPQFTLLALGIAAVALGLARAAIDELVSIAGGKTPQGSARVLAARSRTQSDVAEAEALVRSARGFYYDTMAAGWDAAQSAGRVPVELRRDIRLATTHTVRSCARAVDLMYDLGGGTSVYKTSRLQRCFRDVHVATQHMMVAPSTFELTGRLFLGIDTDVWAL